MLRAWMRVGVGRGLGITLAIAIVVALASTVASADTASEVAQVIKERSAWANKNLKDAPDTVSKLGSIQFWSSGGLMQRVSADVPEDEYVSTSTTPKHVEVLTLVEDKAAVAMYYFEGGFHRKGGDPVTGYLTRVTEVYVKEDGTWKVRAAHWSPVAGGAGTNQNALN